MAKICEVNDVESFIAICGKIKEVRECLTKESDFLDYLVSGKYSKSVFSFISYDDNEKMNGCLILSKGKDFSGDFLFITFIWIDKHSPKLWLKFVRTWEDKAREIGVKRIVISTKRDTKVIERKLGKYDYEKKYNVFEKTVR